MLFYFSIISYKIFVHPTPFYDWDEAINAQVSKEMVDNKSLIPSWQGTIWLDKPPLAFLTYGIIMKAAFFIPPEISLRIFTLGLTIITLVFVYKLFLKASEEKFIALLTVAITAFTPIFLQRAQITNLDVFMLVGWLGYVLFFTNPLLSFIFLAISVFTKSLIGFYPAAIMLLYYIYLFWRKKITFIQFKKTMLQIGWHVSILLLWYVFMLAKFGADFWKQHIVESHFRRVTASIESHFGKKTYYFDLIMEQFGIFGWLALSGFILYILNEAKKWIKKVGEISNIYLLPWFLFLNLTKTKIFWYAYPVIPFFAYFATYPLKIVRKLPLLYYVGGLLVLLFVFYVNFVKQNFFTTYYSQYDNVYKTAIYAKSNCKELNVLVELGNRNTVQTLEQMGLTITTTKWWGNHPEYVYYSGRKVNFIYDINQMQSLINTPSSNSCYLFDKNDLNLNKSNLKLLKVFEPLYLYK